MKETLHYDEIEDKLTVETAYDSEALLDSNKRIRNSLNSKAIQKYNGEMVHALRVEEGDVVRLKNMGYNLLSPSQDELRRALVYIQENEPHLMLVHGKPFARQRMKWA